MAKLGNEARLIIKLSHERMTGRLDEVRSNNVEVSNGQVYVMGAKWGVEEYYRELLTIANELERG